MPQFTRVPTFPTKAAHRTGWWSVPRMRLSTSLTSTVNPTGTEPPCSSNSRQEKSTRKLAQHAPHAVHSLIAKGSGTNDRRPDSQRGYWAAEAFAFAFLACWFFFLFFFL